KCSNVTHAATSLPSLPAAGSVAKILRSMNLSGIFNHDQFVSARKAQNRVHIDGVPVNVNDHDRPCAWGYSRLYLLYKHAPVVRIAIHQYRQRAGAYYGG